MTNLAYPARDNGASASTAVHVEPFAGTFGFDPLDLFGNFFSPFALDATAQDGFDITQTKNAFVVEISMAGYKPDQVDVTCKGNVISVCAKSERRTFSRSFVIPDEIDQENIRAHVEHGLLTLNLSRRPQAAPRRIMITGNER